MVYKRKSDNYHIVKDKDMLEANICVGCGDKFMAPATAGGRRKYCTPECRDKTRSKKDYARLKAKLDITPPDNEKEMALARSFDVRRTIADLSQAKVSHVIRNVIEAMGTEAPPTDHDILKMILAIHLKRLAPALEREKRAGSYGLSQKVTAAMRELRLTANDLHLYGRGDKGTVNIDKLLVIDNDRADAIRSFSKQADADRGVSDVAGQADPAISVSDAPAGEPSAV